MESTSTTNLIPLDAYLFFPTEYEIRRTKSKYPQRAIFEGSLKYEPNENKSIDEFNQEIAKANVVLPSEWTRSNSLRFLQANAFKIPPTIKSIQEHIEWRKNKLPVKLTPTIEEYLRKGIMYIHGRDHRFRPILVINAFMIDPKTINIDIFLDAVTYMLEFLVNNMLLPGQVENWVVIGDLGKKGISELPLTTIKTVFGYLQNNYRARLHKSYIVNAPMTIFLTWKVLKTFMEETTAEKISMEKSNVNKEMFDQINPDQVEIRFGGNAQNVTSFWPPQPCPDNLAVAGDNLKRLLVTEEVYLNNHREGKLGGHTINQSLLGLNNSTKETVDVNGFD